MNAKELNKRIEKISGKQDEDDLWFDVLLAISEGAENARELATIAIQTKLIKLPRGRK